MRCENRLEHQLPKKAGKNSLAPKDSASKGSFTMTLNAAALGSVIAEALMSSFKGLRDLIKAGFTGQGDLIASHADEQPDVDDVSDDGESVVEGKPSAKKNRHDEPGKNRNSLISKLTKTLQFLENVGPAINGDLASLVDKIMREKANEDKIRDLKKQHETPENITTLSDTKVNQGVWNNLDESAWSTDLKFQKVQKSLVKGIIIIIIVT